MIWVVGDHFYCCFSFQCNSTKYNAVRFDSFVVLCFSFHSFFIFFSFEFAGMFFFLLFFIIRQRYTYTGVLWTTTKKKRHSHSQRVFDNLTHSLGMNGWLQSKVRLPWKCERIRIKYDFWLSFQFENEPLHESKKKKKKKEQRRQCRTEQLYMFYQQRPSNTNKKRKKLTDQQQQP